MVKSQTMVVQQRRFKTTNSFLIQVHNSHLSYERKWNREKVMQIFFKLCLTISFGHAHRGRVHRVAEKGYCCMILATRSSCDYARSLFLISAGVTETKTNFAVGLPRPTSLFAGKSSHVLGRSSQLETVFRKIVSSWDDLPEYFPLVWKVVPFAQEALLR